MYARLARHLVAISVLLMLALSAALLLRGAAETRAARLSSASMAGAEAALAEATAQLNALGAAALSGYVARAPDGAGLAAGVAPRRLDAALTRAGAALAPEISARFQLIGVADFSRSAGHLRLRGSLSAGAADPGPSDEAARVEALRRDAIAAAFRVSRRGEALARPSIAAFAGGRAWLIWPTGDGASALGLMVAPTGAANGLALKIAGPDHARLAPAAAPFGDGALIAAATPAPFHWRLDAVLAAAPDITVELALLALVGAAFLIYVRVAEGRVRALIRRQRADRRDLEAKQRALDDSEERFRHIAESTNVIPWSADLERQRFTYVGPQIADLSGFPPTTWSVSGFFAQHVYPADRHRVMGEIHKRRPGGYANVEYRIRAANGRVLYVRNMFTTDPGLDGRMARAQGFILDVTEIKRAEASLKEARQQAEAASRVKDDFLHNMSHELRTPLNAIIGFSEVMKDELFGPMDKRYREYSEHVHSSGAHLLALINEVLDIAKIEAGRIELAEDDTDLAALMRDCMALLADSMSSEGLHALAQIEENLPLMRVDGRRMKQVLLNLLSNAIKFTKPGGSVTIIGRLEKASDSMLIAVRDTGVGMSAEEIPKALSKFGQISGDVAREHAGTGLGLPIAKSLVEMHGGWFEARSEKGVGTEMRLFLPLSRAAPAPATVAAAAS